MAGTAFPLDAASQAFEPFLGAWDTTGAHGLIPGVVPWITSEHEHSGLRTGPVLQRLVDLATGRRVR